MTTRMMLVVGSCLFLSAPGSAVLAGEARPANPLQPIRIDAGDANRLGTPRQVVGQVRVVNPQPIKPQTRISSTQTTAATNLPAKVGAVTQRVAPASIQPARVVTTARKLTPLVVGTVAQDAPVSVDDRAAVDNNARLAPHWTSYAPTTVSYQESRDAMAAEDGYSTAAAPAQPVAANSYYMNDYYANTGYASGGRYYGGYNACYNYSNAYTPYYGYAAYSYPTYYRSSYCAPRYGGYYNSGYYGPRYGGYYSGGSCGSRYGGYYSSGYGGHGGSFGFSYGKGGHCGGSSWGFAIGW